MTDEEFRARMDIVREIARGGIRRTDSQPLKPPEGAVGAVGTMDAETRAYLDAMQETLVRRMEQFNAETRERAECLDAATRRDLGEQMVRLDAETRAHSEQLNAETRAHAERLNAQTRAEARQMNAATRRELGALIEAVDDKVRQVAEGVTGLSEKFDGWAESTDRRLARLEARLP